VFTDLVTDEAGRVLVALVAAPSGVRAGRSQSGWTPLELVKHLALTHISTPGGRFRDSDPRPLPTLAWILTYVLQKYTRHAGHLDVVREEIDGTTGELPGRRRPTSSVRGWPA
jgi:hypothetical protein